MTCQKWDLDSLRYPHVDALEGGRFIDVKSARLQSAQRAEMRSALEGLPQITCKRPDVGALRCGDLKYARTFMGLHNIDFMDGDLTCRDMHILAFTCARVRTLSVDVDGCIRRRHVG